MSDKKHVSVNVDGIHLHARHFASKSEAEAIQAMKDDNITDSDRWAKKAYGECVKAVKEADTPKEEERTSTATTEKVEPLIKEKDLAPEASKATGKEKTNP